MDNLRDIFCSDLDWAMMIRNMFAMHGLSGILPKRNLWMIAFWNDDLRSIYGALIDILLFWV